MRNDSGMGVVERPVTQCYYSHQNESVKSHGQSSSATTTAAKGQRDTQAQHAHYRKAMDCIGTME